MSAHTDREYEAELRRLHEQLLLMGAKVEEMIASSMRALVERDSPLARRMIDFDHQINRLEVEIDELCLRVLAKRQPVASDLRLITIALKLVTDLERIGDMSVNICERVIELNMEPTLKTYVDLPRMAEIVQSMVREALDAFVSADADRAQRVIDRDHEVDAYYGEVFRTLLTYMLEDPRNIYRAIRAQSIAKYLERIGDHATNLAEMVVFMVMGTDIRHIGSHVSEGARRPHGFLFLGVNNAARSQMAEGWAQKLLPSSVRVWSAGTKPTTAINPHAVAVMKEVGVDISSHRPKRIEDIPWGDVDTVITMCAEDVWPLLPEGLRQENWDLPDPSSVRGTQQDAENFFRRTRDDIRMRVEALLRDARLVKR